jgi:hypothetical protein
MRAFHQFRYLKKKPYWGNHFWAKGYCVDTVGLDADMIRKYVRYQEKKEQEMEATIDRLTFMMAAQLTRARPLWGQGLVLPMGGFFKAAPYGAVKKLIFAKLRSFVFNALREQNSLFFNFFTAPTGADALQVLEIGVGGLRIT